MPARLKRWWRRFLGYRDCPICSQQTVKWVKDYIFHPEEPPMFGHWQCLNPDCLVATEVESLPWADKIAQEQGYRTLKDVLIQNYKGVNSDG
jgi:hypothetical protein